MKKTCTVIKPFPTPFKTEAEARQAYADWSSGAESGRSFEGFIEHVTTIEVPIVSKCERCDQPNDLDWSNYCSKCREEYHNGISSERERCKRQVETMWRNKPE